MRAGHKEITDTPIPSIEINDFIRLQVSGKWPVQYIVCKSIADKGRLLQSCGRYLDKQ